LRKKKELKGGEKIIEKKGFTLIELMIVVAIIGILSAIAIPNFMKFQCRAKQSESKTLLAGVFTAEIAYFGEYSRYSLTKLTLGFTPASPPRYYTSPTIASTSLSSIFTATSGGIPSGQGTRDFWSVTNLHKTPTLNTLSNCN
jgi:type IV pilus assembly protein PilA